MRALCGSCTGSEYKNHYFIQTKTANISLNTWPRTLILPPKCSEHCVEHFSCIQNYVKTLGNFRNLTLVGPRHRRRFVQNRTGPVQGPCRPCAGPVQVLYRACAGPVQFLCKTVGPICPTRPLSVKNPLFRKKACLFKLNKFSSQIVMISYSISRESKYDHNHVLGFTLRQVLFE